MAAWCPSNTLQRSQLQESWTHKSGAWGHSGYCTPQVSDAYMEETLEVTLSCSPYPKAAPTLAQQSRRNIRSFPPTREEEICSDGFSLLFLSVPKPLGKLSSLPSRWFWQPWTWKLLKRKSESREHCRAMQLVKGNNTRCCKTLSRTVRAGSIVLSRQEYVSLPAPPFWLCHPLEATYQDSMDCGANTLSYLRSKSIITANRARSRTLPKSSGQRCEPPFARPPITPSLHSTVF